MKKISFVAVLTLVFGGCCWFHFDDGSIATAISPDGRNEIRLWQQPFAYEVIRDGIVVVAKSEIGLKVDGKLLTGNEDFTVNKNVSSGFVDTPIYKKQKVDLSGNETFIGFGDWGIRLAARNDGVAYRFETSKAGKIRVDDEQASLMIPDTNAICSLTFGGSYGCEEAVPQSIRAGDIKTGKGSHKFVYLPFVYSVGNKYVAVTEADVFDYPILNLKRKDVIGSVAFSSEFARWPKKLQRVSTVGEDWRQVDVDAGGRWVQIREHDKYLVETEGIRNFPWRVFVLGDTPSSFPAADIVYALARPKVSHDFSWVKPGKVAWDWWNAFDNKGEQEGCTTQTYRRFIDFAAKTGVEYVIMDEGWSEHLNIWKFSSRVDVPEIIRYGNERGVGIILWMAWAQIVGDEARVAEHFAKLGAKGFKVDFMDRGDADCERFLWKFAEECAKNHMLVDYHGAHRPTGMSRAYPNVLNYEGVHGLECMKFYRGEDFADIDVKHFFLRMTAGPMDYTPGAMDNYRLGTYKSSGINPGSLGTRCRQMALMALYEAPLQMLSDSPTKYERNMECFSFMAKTPVVWDETIGLGGSPDTFASVARRAKDGSWYVAAIANKNGLDYVLDTSFLTAGSWRVEVFRDAADSDVNPTHYIHETNSVVKAGDKIPFKLSPAGGFIAKFVRSE